LVSRVDVSWGGRAHAWLAQAANATKTAARLRISFHIDAPRRNQYGKKNIEPLQTRRCVSCAITAPQFVDFLAQKNAGAVAPCVLATAVAASLRL